MSDVTPASLQIVPDRRRPGRPRVLVTRSSVTAWLPADEHDRLVRLANEQEKSISALVGEILRREISS